MLVRAGGRAGRAGSGSVPLVRSLENQQEFPGRVILTCFDVGMSLCLGIGQPKKANQLSFWFSLATNQAGPLVFLYQNQAGPPLLKVSLLVGCPKHLKRLTEPDAEGRRARGTNSKKDKPPTSHPGPRRGGLSLASPRVDGRACRSPACFSPPKQQQKTQPLTDEKVRFWKTLVESWSKEN